jgi:hypothetical protein
MENSRKAPQFFIIEILRGKKMIEPMACGCQIIRTYGFS